MSDHIVTNPESAAAADRALEPSLDSLREVEQRVLWLATAMIDHANRVRGDSSGVKVGGHQASSASIATIMTALWFTQLRAVDRVSVKPHASPVLHAINYLLGELDEKYLTTLRSIGGLQSYPSRSKDPDPVDYSTGSVGIGATAPIWGAIARRFVRSQQGQSAVAGRQYSLVGDAELDEGAIWEAVLDPSVAELGEIVWIVDFNRQSLDRVVPNISATRIHAMFAAAGWQVLSVKFGRILEELFARPDGPALRRRIDEMTNPEYQRLLRCTPAELRTRLPGEGPDADAIRRVIAQSEDVEIHGAIRNLGGHDLGALTDAFAAIDDDRPTVIFAYTVKGNGLPNAGHPQNHSNQLTQAQMRELADRVGMDLDDPWRRFAAGTEQDQWCRRAALRLTRDPVAAQPPPEVPSDLGRTPVGKGSTQQALGRALVDLTRQAPAAGARVVTVSPDVASSTNLGGWLNKVGSWSPGERVDWFADDAETILHWRETPTGQHIELGIAETNLVGLIGELGSTWSRWGHPLMPIGVLYDPFVGRALEPWSFGMYAGGQSILVGTPSGVSLASEGGAHQSITTPSIGLEQPGCTAYEPAFALDLEWCLLDGLSRLGRPDGSSTYLRLSTRPVDQTSAQVPADPAARERRRRQVVAGAYVLQRVPDAAVSIAVMGAMVPEALAAATRLAALGVGCDVLCITSPDLLFRAVRARQGQGSAASWILDQVFPAHRAAPLVTVLDGHPHTLAFLSAINNVPSVNLGVDGFGQAGALAETYAYHHIDADAILSSCLDLLADGAR